MRIALISRRFDPHGGGTERDLLVTAQILEAAGYPITIYAAELRGTSEHFTVKRLPGARFGRAIGLLRFASSAARIARADGADLVLSFARIIDADVLRSGGSAHSSYLRAARQWRGAARALAMRAQPYHRAQMAIERRGFASPRLKRAITVSNLVRNDLIGSFKLDPANVVTIYNGVDLERFRPPADTAARAALRRTLALDEDAPVVAFAGNGFARKGLGFLVRAWPAVRDSAQLLIAGNDRSRAFYERLAREVGAGERVRFVGAQSRIEEIFAATDALALPSLFEPFGNVAMEAMASGLPVLVSAACGVAEVLADPMKKFVVSDPTDIAALASRINELLEARHELAAVARETAAGFTWQRYGEELVSLLEGL